MKVEGFYSPQRRVFHPADHPWRTTRKTRKDEEEGVDVMGRSIIGQGTITAVFLPYPLNPRSPCSVQFPSDPTPHFRPSANFWSPIRSLSRIDPALGGKTRN